MSGLLQDAGSSRGERDGFGHPPAGGGGPPVPFVPAAAARGDGRAAGSPSHRERLPALGPEHPRQPSTEFQFVH